jgi:O-antigen/teichoic acid export membrane protein
MDESTMKKHVTLVSALQIGFSTIGLIGAIVIFFVFNFANSFVMDDEVANTVLRFLSVALPMAIGSVSAIGLIGGIGLLSYQEWARILVLIIAAIGCMNVPFGTIKGVYSIWVLMQDETIKLFKR